MKAPLFTLLLIAPFSGFCQDDGILLPPRMLFKTAPQSFVTKSLKIGVEVFNKSHNKSYSLYLTGRMDGQNGSPVLYYYDDFYQGLGAEFQYRKYLNGFKNYQSKRGKNFLQGIYLAGYLNGSSHSNKGEFSTTHYNPNTGQHTVTSYYMEDYILNWGAGFTIGFHRTFWKVLFFDAYLGGGFQLSEIDRNPDLQIPTEYYFSSYQGITSPGYQGIMPKFGIALGVVL